MAEILLDCRDPDKVLRDLTWPGNRPAIHNSLSSRPTGTSGPALRDSRKKLMMTPPLRSKALMAVIGLVAGLAASPTSRADGAKAGDTPYPARVGDDRRTLIDQHGKPFFYLGDTAWELFHRLSQDEAGVYLRDRASARFNVIQAVVLAELDGLSQPNAQGHRPLLDNDPTRPDEAYFED